MEAVIIFFLALGVSYGIIQALDSLISLLFFLFDDDERED